MENSDTERKQHKKPKKITIIYNKEYNSRGSAKLGTAREEHKHILETFDRVLYFVGIILLVGLNIIAISYLTLNVTNIKTEILSMNPPEKTSTRYMALYYPPSNFDAPAQTFDENFTMHDVSFSVDLYLKYEGTLAEGIPVDLAAIGALYPDGQGTIDYVAVGFGGSNHYQAQDNAVPRFRPQLHNASALSVYSEAPILGTVSWSTQGSYYPSVSIFFKNGSAPIVVDFQDDTHKLYIESYTVIRNQDNDRVIRSIETVGVFFACEGGLAFLVRTLRKKRLMVEDDEDSDEETTNQQKHAPNKNKKK